MARSHRLDIYKVDDRVGGSVMVQIRCTKNEFWVLVCLANGVKLTNIAKQLGLSYEVVRSRLRRIRHRNGMHSKTALAVAWNEGWVIIIDMHNKSS